MLDDLLHRAFELIETGNLEAAGEIVEAVIGEDPKNARAWRLRAQVATERGEKVAYLKRALELAPHHLETREQLEALGEALPPLTLEPDDTAPIRMGKPEVNIDQTQVSSRTQVLETRKLLEEPEPPADSTTRSAVVEEPEPASRRGCMWAILLLFVIVIGGGIILMVAAPDQPQVASLWALIRPSATPTVTATPPPTETELPTPTSVPTLTATLPSTETAIPASTTISEPTITPSPTDLPTPMPPRSARLDDGSQAILFSAEPGVPALQDRDNFGWSVDVDGDTLVVGAPDEFNATGRVYIYIREGENWRLQQHLSPDTPEGSNDLFGWSVALDGDTLVVGAPGDSTLVGEEQQRDQFQGAAYVFTREAGEWQKTFSLLPQMSSQMFGNAVDIDGESLVVGAPAIDPAADRNGMVFIYRPGDLSRSTWEEEQVIGGAGGEAFEGFFGYRLALDGDILVVSGQPVMNANDDTIHIFEFDGDSWEEQPQLKNEQHVPEDRFGFAIAADGSRIAVSNLPAVLPSNNNVVTIYEDTGDSGGWESTGMIQNPAGALSFGHSIDLEGDVLVIGAPWLGQSGNQAGRVYVYAYDGQNWVQSHSFVMPPALSASGDFPLSMVGWSVAVDGDQIVTGAPDQWTSPEAVGSALLFNLAP